MRLLVDEGVDRSVVERLRAEGHHVRYAAEFDPGAMDEVLLASASASGEILVTADKDLLRLAGLPAGEKAAIVASALAEHGIEIPGTFCAITGRAIRIRRLP